MVISIHPPLALHREPALSMTMAASKRLQIADCLMHYSLAIPQQPHMEPYHSASAIRRIWYVAVCRRRVPPFVPSLKFSVILAGSGIFVCTFCAIISLSDDVACSSRIVCASSKPVVQVIIFRMTRTCQALHLKSAEACSFANTV
jgi:hypothetical protein